MDCPRCHAANPEVARYCYLCGDHLLPGELNRKDHYAVNPDEPVASLSLVTTIMPHGSGTMPNTYRIALLVALAFPVVGAALGLLSFAIMTAAFAVPVVYIVYLYDVNLWEDNPVSVTVMAFAFTGVLSVGFTYLWSKGFLSSNTSGPSLASKLAQTPRVKELLVICLLVPVAGEVVKQIGPIFLAARPQFDDLMDGLTFGVISGVAYAAFETLTYNWGLIDNGFRTEQANPALWVSIVITAGLIKPVVYGTASGIACAEFSGLGEGYEGFTPRYLRGVLEAMAANVLYQLGIYLAGLVRGTTGAILGMLWGLLIAAALIFRVRVVLHRGLLEAALEAAARHTISKHATREIGFCPHCEMPLLDQSMFCIACGRSVLAVSKVVRHLNEEAGNPFAVEGVTVGASMEEGAE